ncbi:hypothetical protein [Nocardia brasiliensis]|uniref:hypothetical protein n=1 Tax=Nocardia brasiliensis TaxID=37326 RepID=UPI00366C06FE
MAAVSVLANGTAVAGPTKPAYICKEMSFKGPQGLGIYCNATAGAPTTGKIVAGFTIDIEDDGPTFSCTNGTATQKTDGLEIAGRCHGLSLGKTDGAVDNGTDANSDPFTPFTLP